MSLILQVFYSVFSGLCLALSIPNDLITWGSPLIVFMALIPLYLSLRNCNSYKQAFFLGSLQVATTHLISSSWLGFFQDFAIITLLSSAFGTALIGGLFGFALYLPYDSHSKKNILNLYSLNESRTVLIRIFHFAVLYTLYEWYKGIGFLGYPWGITPLAMFKAPVLMQVTAITGTMGISFLVSFFAAISGETIALWDNYIAERKSKWLFKEIKYSACFWIILMTLTLIYGTITYNIKRTPDRYLTTIIVQQNENPWNVNTDNETILRSEQLTQKKLDELNSQQKNAHLIVWSEGCLKKYFPLATSFYERNPSEYPLIEFIRDTRTPLLAGSGLTKTKEMFTEYYNVAVAFDGDGNYRGYYAKNHLVPMAEAIPLSNNPKIKRIMKKYFGMGAGYTAGDQYTLFEIPCEYSKTHIEPASKIIDLSIPYFKQMEIEQKAPTVKIATPICYDDAFNDIIRPLYKAGAELFVNLTDDSWSMKTTSEIQHFVVASYRAIEYRTTLVRSTNSGYSAVVDPSGKILAELPLFEEASLTYDIPVYTRKPTVFARFGDWVPAIFLVAFIIELIVSIAIFSPDDYIPSERKLWKKKKSKKHNKH